jgi:PEGA domain
MFHIDVESKRFRNAVRFFTYGIMTTATLALTVIVLLLALGYRINRNTLTVVRDGLVQLASEPTSANFLVTGVKTRLSGTTSARVTLAAGRYTFQLSEPGYRTWTRTFDVIAGHVHWITYPRLIPTTLTSAQQKQYSQISFAEVSPDGQWLLVYTDQPGAKNQLQLVNLQNPKKLQYSTLTIPASILTQNNGDLGDLSFVEWSLDSQHVLLKHTIGSTTEFISLDRTDPQAAVNLSTEFQLPIADAHFSGSDANIIYARTTDNVVRRFDVSGQESSGALLDNVQQFSLYGSDTIVFDRDYTPSSSGTTTPTPVQQVGLQSANQQTVVATYPVGDALNVQYTEYDQYDYFIVADDTTGVTKVYEDPQDPQSAGTPIIQINDIKPDFVTFDPAGRFLTLQEGSHIVIYDFYEGMRYDYTLPFSLSLTQEAYWIDDFHLAAVVNGKLEIWDFDGSNQQSLVTASSAYKDILDDGTNMLYTFKAGTSKTGPAIDLEQTNLKVQ